jgi:hypothetical protein
MPATSGAPLRDFVDELEAKLAGELETHVDEPVFRDTAELSGGAVLDPALSEALCTSAAWVVVYVPRYLRRPYCRREFAAMLLLEQQRRQALNGQLAAKSGMIIPLLLRGKRVELPLPQAQERLWGDFTAYDPKANPIDGNPGYSQIVRDVAGSIAALCELGKHLDAVLGHCGQFELPPDPSGQAWVAPPEQVFPNRT